MNKLLIFHMKKRTRQKKEERNKRKKNSKKLGNEGDQING